MRISLMPLLVTLSSIFRSRATLQLENLALRHQIGVLRRSARTRPKLTSGDRLLWVWLSRIWSDWRSALAIVQPETVIAWHRAGFRLFWTWKVRRGQPGRPLVSREVRDLIRKMCRENPGWGAPRIHGELLKLRVCRPWQSVLGPPQSARTDVLGTFDPSLEPVDSSTPRSAPLSRCTLPRHSSFVRAVCVNALVRICAGAISDGHPYRDSLRRVDVMELQ
jgi:hypothetical protein